MLIRHTDLCVRFQHSKKLKLRSYLKNAKKVLLSKIIINNFVPFDIKIKLFMAF